MTQLATGASASVTLAAGDSIKIMRGGDGLVQVGPGRLSIPPQRVGATDVVIGPFPEQRTVQLTANTALTYYSVPAGTPSGRIVLTAAEIASPTADQLADTASTYQLNVAPYTRYQSSGTALAPLGGSIGSSGFLGVKDVTGTTYTVLEADSGYMLRVTNASGCTVTVPVALSASHQFGVYIELGAGNATLQGDGTSTVVTKGSTLVTSGVKSTVQVLNLGSNVYFATGDLGALGATDIYSAVVALLAAGSNVTLTPNGSNSISIASTGGSGGGDITVGAMGAAVAYSGADTTEHTLWTFTVPANAMGTKGSLRVTFKTTSSDSSSPDQWRVKFGGVQAFQFNHNSSNQSRSSDQCVITNRGVTNAQICPMNRTDQAADIGGAQNSAFTTLTIDTTAAQDITITVTKGLTTNTATLEMAMVEIIKPSL
jgi:hypothetical protein